MATYDCILDYGVQPGAEYISQSANWVVTVFRFLYPNTFSRKTMNSFQTLTSGAYNAVTLRGNPLVLTDSVLSLNVGSNKSSHTMSMSATLAPDLNYEAQIFPGDWVFAHMFTNDVDFQSVVARLAAMTPQQGQSVNNFNDGLKFVGRVQSMRKSLVQNPDGTRVVSYALQCTGFGEFDSTIFFDPNLVDKNLNTLGLLWGQLGIDIATWLSDSQNQGVLVQRAQNALIDLLMGQGVPGNQSRGGAIAQHSIEGQIRVTIPGQNNAKYAYLIPSVVAQGLGKTTTGTVAGFKDILETCVGVQKYSTAQAPEQSYGPQQGANQSTLYNQVSQAFQPSNLASTGNDRQTSDSLIGVVLPQPLQFNNVPFWSILTQFLNTAVNENYVCLRVNFNGQVVPTYVARQLPFNTDSYTGNILQRSADDSSFGVISAATPPGGPIVHTKFLELPTWGIDPTMVLASEVGRSDSLRFNFIRIYGDFIQAPEADQFSANPPVLDNLDVARNGLRSYNTTVACGTGDVRGVLQTASKWMSLMSDILIGQQMTLTGTLSCAGIQSPICIGDNVEWEGTTFHIEGINHVCNIGPDGHKNFATVMTLTHGLRTTPIPDTTGTPDMGIYSQTLPDDMTQDDPGLTVDFPDQPPADLSVAPGYAAPQGTSTNYTNTVNTGTFGE